MMLLYAVVPSDATAPDVPGLAGRPLEIIRAAAAAVIVEECPDRHQPRGGNVRRDRLQPGRVSLCATRAFSDRAHDKIGSASGASSSREGMGSTAKGSQRFV